MKKFVKHFLWWELPLGPPCQTQRLKINLHSPYPFRKTSRAWHKYCTAWRVLPKLACNVAVHNGSNRMPNLAHRPNCAEAHEYCLGFRGATLTVGWLPLALGIRKIIRNTLDEAPRLIKTFQNPTLSIQIANPTILLHLLCGP